jgi:putative membrane protein
MHVNEEEQRQINKLVAEAEEHSGIQALIVIVSKADAYPEIPWKAFALAAAFTALIVMANALYSPEWSAARAGLLAGGIILAGAVSALLTLFIPSFARLFLSAMRAEAEVRQHAEAVFLQRGLFETRARIGTLVFIARFEREAVIVADTGVRRHVSEQQLTGITAQAKPLLGRAGLVAACAACLSGLTLLLQDLIVPSVSGDEIQDTLVQERGV